MNINTNYDSSVSSEESPFLSTTDSKDSRISEIYSSAQITIDFETVISLQRAHELLSQMAKGKAFCGLNTLNLFHFEVMRTLQELMRNRETRKLSQDSLNELSTKFFLIFRAFRKYSLNGQASSDLRTAKNLWGEVRDLIPQIAGQTSIWFN